MYKNLFEKPKDNPSKENTSNKAEANLESNLEKEHKENKATTIYVLQGVIEQLSTLVISNVEQRRVFQQTLWKLQQSKETIGVLQSIIVQLSTTVTGNEEQRRAFQEKLDVFLSDKGSNFLLIADRFNDTERKLEIVQNELDQSNKRYSELLGILEKNVETIKTLSTETTSEQTPKSNLMGELLVKKGIYAPKQENQVPGTESKSSLEFN